MASDHPLLARLEQTVSRYRDKASRLGSEVAHLREEREIVMQYLSDFGTALKTLIGDRQASDTRASTAEAALSALQAQVASDEATLKGLLDDVTAENEAEAPADPASTATVTNPTATTTVTVNPASATSPTTDSSTGVSTGPGTTTHVDSSTGVTTTVPHDGSDPTAVTAGGTAVAPDPSVVAAATSATQAAGVTVASAATS